MKHIQQLPVLAWFVLCWYIFVTGALVTTVWSPFSHLGGSQELRMVLFLVLAGIHLSCLLYTLVGKWTQAVRLRVLLGLSGGVLLLTQVAQSPAVTYTFSLALLLVASASLQSWRRLVRASGGYVGGVVLYALTFGSTLDWSFHWDGTGATTLFFLCFSLGGLLLFLQQQRTHQQTQRLFHQLDDAYAHLQEAHRQLSAFALHIEDLTMLNERQRLARELHDTLVQGMAGVLMQLEVIATHARQSHLERVQTLLQQAMTDTREVLSDARCALSDLRAEHVRPDDLVDVVLEEIHRFTASADIPCVTQIEPLAHTPPALCVQVLRVISEGLTNIARHAQARQVEVRASFADSVLQLELCDDGVGFDPATIKPEEGHYGLLGLRERALLIGGHLLIVSQPGQGTRLCLQIPLISSEEACA